MAEIQDTATAVQFMAQEFPDHPVNGVAYAVRVTPEYGRSVILYVRANPRSRGNGYMVTRHTSGEGYITRHVSFTQAVGAANRRANKYLTQHSKPFGTQRAKVPA